MTGSIQRQMDAFKPKIFSVADAVRVCAERDGHAYCGRGNGRRSTVWAEVTCNDCRAAHNADGGERLELIEAKR